MRRTIAAILALGVGLLTIHSLRNRSKQEADPREQARTEATEATEHANAALAHARRAGGHAVEYARGEIETVDVPAPDETEQRNPRLIRHLR